jgi:outer membrane biosynthesis protein TonB
MENLLTTKQPAKPKTKQPAKTINSPKNFLSKIKQPAKTTQAYPNQSQASNNTNPSQANTTTTTTTTTTHYFNININFSNHLWLAEGFLTQIFPEPLYGKHTMIG